VVDLDGALGVRRDSVGAAGSQGKGKSPAGPAQRVGLSADASFGADVPTMSRSAAYVAFGAGAQPDSRYASTGLFAHVTNIGRSWWWIA
jgi:hypothetical protein